MLFQDSIPTDVTRALRVTMVNILHVDSFDLVDSLDNSHWSVEVFAFHRIATPCVTRSQVSSQAQGWVLVSRMRKWGDLRAHSQHSALKGVEGAC
jgi:hypothetical protein